MKDLKEKIGILFVNKCAALLTCKYLEVDRKLYQLEAHRKMLKFCKLIQTYDLQQQKKEAFDLEESKEHLTSVRKV